MFLSIRMNYIKRIVPVINRPCRLCVACVVFGVKARPVLQQRFRRLRHKLTKWWDSNFTYMLL
jgi:hypothetical protein